MYSHYNYNFKRDMYIVKPGEYYSSKEDVVISTVLGSCISVILYDEKAQAAGLNHFMLPGNKKGDAIPMMDAKYGVHAMELLINSLYKLGAAKERFKAKVFGGGSVLAGAGGSALKVPEENIEFAFIFLKTEKIPITASDVGGNRARKIFLFPKDFRVILKRLSPAIAVPVEIEEKLYLQKLRKTSRQEKEENNYVIFSDKTGKEGGEGG